MKRRNFFKSAALAFAAAASVKLTPVEAKAAQEVQFPARAIPTAGGSAFVTTVKGQKARICHNLNTPHVAAMAVNLQGKLRCPRVDVIDKNTVELTFEEPPSWFRKNFVYKVVLSSYKKRHGH